jgi:hypothetical protein
VQTAKRALKNSRNLKTRSQQLFKPTIDLVKNEMAMELKLREEREQLQKDIRDNKVR